MAKPKKVDYTKNDMLTEACFESDKLKLTLYLVPSEEHVLPNGQIRKVSGTGLKIRFKGGRLRVNNRAVLSALLESNDYKRGKFWPDREDPTGFWRANKAIKTETVTVEVARHSTRPSLEDLDLTVKPEDVDPISTEANV